MIALKERVAEILAQTQSHVSVQVAVKTRWADSTAVKLAKREVYGLMRERCEDSEDGMPVPSDAELRRWYKLTPIEIVRESSLHEDYQLVTIGLIATWRAS